MASASPAAILAVPERPVAERPEAKAPDASDGGFAGLMAQFVLPQAAPHVSAPASEATSSPEQEAAPGEPIQARAEAASPAPAAPAAPSSSAPATPEQPDAEPQAQGALAAPVAPTPGIQILANPLPVAATTLPVTGNPIPAAGANPEPPNPTLKVPLNAPPVPQAAAAAASLGTAPAEPGKGTVPFMRPVASPEEAAQPSSAKTAAVQGLPGTTVAPEPLPVEQTSEAHLAPVAQPKVDAAALQIQAQASTLQPDPGHPRTATLIQAVLAEPAASPQVTQVVAAAVPAEPLRPATKTPPVLEIRFTPREPLQPPANAPARPLPVPVSQEPADGTPGTRPSLEPTADQARPLPTTAPTAPSTTLVHAPDGSSLAALGTVPKTVAAAPAQALPATLATATPPSPPVLQVEGGVRWMLKAGAQEAQLQLHPESLGQVTIHLRVEGGEVHARLWVTEPASVRVVQEGRAHLEATLKEQGLQLGSFDLQQGQRPFHDTPSTPAHHERATAEPTPARQEAPAGAPVSILNPHHVELYA